MYFQYIHKTYGQILYKKKLLMHVIVSLPYRPHILHCLLSTLYYICIYLVLQDKCIILGKENKRL